MSNPHRSTKARELQSIAQLVEDSILNFEKEEERRFYHEVVQSYRAAARELLRDAWLGKIKTESNLVSCAGQNRRNKANGRA